MGTSSGLFCYITFYCLFYCWAAAPDHSLTRSLSRRVPDHSDFVFMRRPIPTRAPSRAQASHFPAAVGSQLSSRFLEQLSDTIVFPLWATLMLTATFADTVIDASHHRLSAYPPRV
jgi:hypothetical protein